MPEYKCSVFIFRRDLRLDDNTGLLAAMRASSTIIPLFIFTPTQIAKNKFRSSNAIQFMIESLEDLDQQIHASNLNARLWTMYGDEVTVLKKIHNIIPYEAIFVNEDYTPYSIKRDIRIRKFAKEKKVSFFEHSDSLLLDTQEIKAKNGNYYKIFTQFYNNAINKKIRQPNYEMYDHFRKVPVEMKKYNINNIKNFFLRKKWYEENPKLAIHGGRENGIMILKGIKLFKNYDSIRNYPEFETTHLSPHNKFGTLSIREVYNAFKKRAKNAELCKQLYWRDFYYYICVHFPETFEYNHLMKKTKRSLIWENNKNLLKAWKTATTGFPIIDAAMTQMNNTGYMHNRCRMIVAMFLSKDLLVDWKYGEKYFTKKLVDIDRCQNIGNWNWSSSFGLDNTSFLRIFNPWTQSKEYDPNCIYIKKWLPELSGIPNEHIHNWYKFYDKYDVYSKPIVDHEIQRKKYLKFYKYYFG